MSTLIDGYNLLNTVGIVGPRPGPGGLERSRLALLNFLAESLDAAEIPRTTVVFDAHDAPPGLPRVLNHRGITVRYAAKYDEADTLIEELIQADSAPRRLTVVSSDHRLQKAARRRRARAVDSDVWYAEVVRRRRERHAAAPTGPAHPAVPLLEEDVNYWVRQFGGQEVLDRVIAEEQTAGQREGPPASELPMQEPAPSDKPLPGVLPELDNPFPPGYGEELKIEDLPGPKG
jgi:predicted RNA-binding protein with PIN domain